MFELIRVVDPEFASIGTMQAPLLIGQGLDEMLFHRALRLQIRDEITTQIFVGLLVFIRQHNRFAGEAVAGCVEAGALLAFGRAGPSGELRVIAVSDRLNGGGRHKIIRLECRMRVCGRRMRKCGMSMKGREKIFLEDR